MPRGNDAEAAGQELKARERISDLNAEDLIKRNAERWPASLRAANAKRIDPDATAALDPAAVAKLVEGEEVQAYAVRGDSVIVVSEDEYEQTHKRDFPLKDVGHHKAAKAAPAKAEAKADKADEADEAAQPAAAGKHAK